MAGGPHWSPNDAVATIELIRPFPAAGDTLPYSAIDECVISIDGFHQSKIARNQASAAPSPPRDLASSRARCEGSARAGRRHLERPKRQMSHFETALRSQIRGRRILSGRCGCFSSFASFREGTRSSFPSRSRRSRASGTRMRPSSSKASSSRSTSPARLRRSSRGTGCRRRRRSGSRRSSSRARICRGARPSIRPSASRASSFPRCRTRAAFAMRGSSSCLSMRRCTCRRTSRSTRPWRRR